MKLHHPKNLAHLALALGLALASAGLVHADDSSLMRSGDAGAPAAATLQATAPTADTLEAPAAASDELPQVDHIQDWRDVMQLGQVEVQGDREEESRRIIAGLKVVKHALKNKLTNDPADADVVVCRMNYDTGSHLLVHLRCATNAALNAERRARGSTFGAASSAEPAGAELVLLEHMDNAAAGVHYFSSVVNASQLQKLLLQIQCDDCSNSGLVVGDN